MAETPDVHVDWHMTPGEWRQLCVALWDHADTPYIARLIEAGKLPAPIVAQQPQTAPGPARIRVTATDLGTMESSTVEITDDYVLICAGTCHRYYVEDRFDGTHVITVKGRRQGPRSVADPEAKLEPLSLEATIAAVGPDTPIGRLLSHVAGTDECAPQPAPELALMEAEAAQVRSAMAEITRIHDELLEEILKNADEDINGGDEAAEYLAEHYVRWLETERGRLIELAEHAEPLTVKPADDVQPAPELRDAWDAARLIREQHGRLLDRFTRGSAGYNARLSGVILAREYRDAGLPVPERLSHLRGQL